MAQLNEIMSDFYFFIFNYSPKIMCSITERKAIPFIFKYIHTDGLYFELSLNKVVPGSPLLGRQRVMNSERTGIYSRQQING